VLWTILYKFYKTLYGYQNDNISEPTEEHKREYLGVLVSCLCEKPSKMLNIDSVKGSLSKGKICDLVVFDPDAPPSEITQDDIFSRHPTVNIYLKQQLRSKIKATYLRGNLIYSDSDMTVLKDKSFG
jgi:dihydroorotase-like cyclic amidohydrolase